MQNLLILSGWNWHIPARHAAIFAARKRHVASLLAVAIERLFPTPSRHLCFLLACTVQHPLEQKDIGFLIRTLP